VPAAVDEDEVEGWLIAGRLGAVTSADAPSPQEESRNVAATAMLVPRHDLMSRTVYR
jgi:hypothetical protein